jgi:hypothetical protein
MAESGIDLSKLREASLKKQEYGAAWMQGVSSRNDKFNDIPEKWITPGLFGGLS